MKAHLDHPISMENTIQSGCVWHEPHMDPMDINLGGPYLRQARDGSGVRL